MYCSYTRLRVELSASINSVTNGMTISLTNRMTNGMTISTINGTTYGMTHFKEDRNEKL